MPLIMIETNRKALMEKVENSEHELHDVLAKLGRDLGVYGWHGSLKLELNVVVDPKHDHSGAKLQRSIELHFKS